jgi:superfamily II DNA or RNA helicase
MSEISLRSYQTEACDRIESELQSVKSTLLVLPTGVGKTITFAELARRYSERGQRVLILAHRDELISQAVDKVSRIVNPDLITVEKANQVADREKLVIVGGVQTLQKKRLESWPKDFFDLIVIDEAHHASAKTYANIIEHFKTSDIVGVTATPYRQGKAKLSDVFESRAFEMDLWAAIDAGHLCPITALVSSEKIDLRSVRTLARDFNDADLGHVIEANISKIVDATVKHCRGRQRVLIFVPTVACAEKLALEMQARQMSADFIHGGSEDRAEKLDDFASGLTRVLINASLLTEGFDCPGIDAVVIARPTKSQGLLVQMVGRGTRNSPGKTDLLILDFSWELTTGDIASLLEDPTRPGTRCSNATDRVIDLAEARETARIAAILREAEVNRERLKMQPLQLRGQKLKDVMELNEVGFQFPEVRRIGPPATARQLEVLSNWLGLKWTPQGLTVADASDLLDHLSRRREAGLATPKQIRLIQRISPDEDPATLTFEEAGEIIDTALGSRAFVR